jgi:hypothetical protein
MVPITSNGKIVVTAEQDGMIYEGISCMAFVMEMLKLHRGNTSFSIQIRCNPADMFVAVQRSMQNEEELLNAVHANHSSGYI